MIKLASIHNVKELTEFTAKGFAHYENYARHGINKKKIQNTVVGMIANPSSFILIDQRDGEIIGAIGGIIMEMGYTDATFATDLCFYVKPEYVKKGIGKELFTAFVMECASMGASEIRTGATTGENGATIEKFCEDCGFTRRGVLYDMTFGE